MKALTFTLEEHRFGLPLEQVLEITRAVAIARLPDAPALVEGVVDVRGTLIPVLDLRRRLRLPDHPLSPDQHFVLATAGRRPVALRVDRALDVLDVPDELIDSGERVVPGVGRVAGIARLPDGVLVIHDLDAFLSVEDAATLGAALDGYQGDASSAAGRSPGDG